MPFQVERIPDKNIVIVRTDGGQHPEDAHYSYQAVAEILDTMEGTVYRIADVRGQTMTYEALLELVDLACRGKPGSLTDPRVKNIWVGREYYALRARELFQERGVLIPLFATMEEALEAVERMLENQSLPSTDADSG
jgi:hypothetical protein